MANFYISKVSIDQNGTLEKAIIHRAMMFTDEGEEKDRNWILSSLRNGLSFQVIFRSSDGKWIFGSFITVGFDGSIRGLDGLPKILTRRKSFISYYHKDDEIYRTAFENISKDLIVNKSVKFGDIDSSTSDEYAKQLIQKNYLHDTTVLIVLIGPKTKCRMHVDWEISAALNFKVGDTYAGLLGLLLPTHPDFGNEKVTTASLPARLADNLKSEYAIVADWSTEAARIQELIELAYSNRKEKAIARVNSRIQMKTDDCA